MPTFYPEILAAWTGGRWTRAPEGEIVGLNQDTRTLVAGQLFVALSTPKRDGHAFVPAAAQAGAVGALVQREVADASLPQLIVRDPLAAWQAIAREHRRAFPNPVVGISGSCGKTSTKNLLARLLGDDGDVLATQGNLNNHIGVPLTLQRLDASAHRFAVVEAGISAPGEMDVLAGMIDPDFAIITLVAHAHTAELGGLEGVAREKAALLRRLRRSGLGVFPQQCFGFAAFRDLPGPSLVLVPEGEKSTARWQKPFAVRHEGAATLVQIDGRAFRLRRVSRGMAQNAALALALASEMGVSDDQLQRRLQGWEPAQLRGEMRQVGGRWLYLDCYNANPAAMSDAIEVFRETAPADQPHLYLIGGMEELGPESPAHHRTLGRHLPLRAQDEVWVIGAQAAEVAAGARELNSRARIEVIQNLDTVALRLAEFQGAVFVKGSRRYELEKALPLAAHAH